MRETLFDFNFGYITSALLSICFVTLGAYMFFGTGNELATSSDAFANQVVEIFSGNIGQWSYMIIAAASFSIMFGTCIAVFDGYARAMERTSELLFLSRVKASEALKDTRFYNGSILVIGVGAYALIHHFIFATGNVQGFKKLVDVATTLSFIVAPVIAIANYRLVTATSFPPEAKPRMWLRTLSVTGIMFLTGFTIYYFMSI